MKELVLSVITKLLASTLLVFWMLMTLILSVSLIGILVVIEEEWSEIGIKLTNSLLK